MHISWIIKFIKRNRKYICFIDFLKYSHCFYFFLSFQNLNQTFFNLGAGAFYFTDNYYLGLSVPNFLPNKQLKEANGVQKLGLLFVDWGLNSILEMK